MSQPDRSTGVMRAGGNSVIGRAPRPESLADVLERVLDKGVVVVGDIGVSLLDIELLTLKIRLLIASADTAQQMGIDWWRNDPFYSSEAREKQGQDGELERRVAALEQDRSG